MPDQTHERGIMPVPDHQERAPMPAGAPGEGLEFLDHAALDGYSGLLPPCSNDAHYDIMDGFTQYGAYDFFMMTDPPITWDNSDNHSDFRAEVPSIMPDQAGRGSAAVPGEGLEFVNHVAFDNNLCLPSPCSNDTYRDTMDGATYKMYDDLLPRTIMPNPRIAWDDVCKLDESTADVPLIMPGHDGQDRGMGPVAAHGEGLEFDEYLGLRPPHSNDTNYDAMAGATYKVYDDLLPRTIMPDSKITWDDVYGMDETEGGESCSDVASHGEGLEFVDQAAFDENLGLHPHHSMTGADNTYYDAINGVTHSADNSVFPPVTMCIPRISWDDSCGHKKKRKLHGTKVGGKLDEADVGKRDSCAAKKTQKIIWSDTGLHEQFVEVVNKLGGIDRAVPKKILELMNLPGLTKENVASHLQKYRIRLRKESTEQEKVEAAIQRFPESYNYQGPHQPPLQQSTDLPFVPTMWQQQMNIRNATYMEPRQIGAMPDYSSLHEPTSGHLYGLAANMPQQRQNVFLPEQHLISHLHGNISEHYSTHRMLPDDLDHVNMGITGTERHYCAFPAVAANVHNFEELDGNLRTHASSFEALDNVTRENGVEKRHLLRRNEDNTQPERFLQDEHELNIPHFGAK